MWIEHHNWHTKEAEIGWAYVFSFYCFDVSQYQHRSEKFENIKWTQNNRRKLKLPHAKNNFFLALAAHFMFQISASRKSGNHARLQLVAIVDLSLNSKAVWHGIQWKVIKIYLIYCQSNAVAMPVSFSTTKALCLVFNVMELFNNESDYEFFNLHKNLLLLCLFIK